MINTECLQGMDFVEKFLCDYENLEKMGFKKLGEQRTEDGIPFIPMEAKAE